jgi:2-isopropylmalate synthase
MQFGRAKNHMKDVLIYDTTLRDGCQAEDISFSLEDKLRIAVELDRLGVDYIEGGYPGSNAKDLAFFAEVKQLRLKHARVAAFGNTRRSGLKASEDPNLKVLLKMDVPVVTLVGKTWDLHVRDDLRVSKEENLKMIRDSISHLRKRVEEIVFDAEHFFDGYRANPDYAMECLLAADEAGADWICLCDTNGGSLPTQIARAVLSVKESVSVRLGIHCHNDSDLGVANTIAAVEAGVTQVQGTINGFGERCGNANLCSVIPNLELKLGKHCIGKGELRHLRKVSRVFYELANLFPNKHQPYVGQSAFAHKGGLHIAAIRKNRATYEHVNPELVGNSQRVLVSELSGRSSILYKAKEYGIDLKNSDKIVQEILSELKKLESQGYLYEGAEASFELLIQRTMGQKRTYFRLIGFRVLNEKQEENKSRDVEATVVVEVDGRVEHAAAMGNGPVNALDRALRKALLAFYPQLNSLQLLDYKVRVLSSREGTGAPVRVLIESGDGKDRWGTVGVSRNLIEASWQALVDSIEYKLYKDSRIVE